MRLLTGVAAALALLAAPSTGLAQTALPVGEAHGVRVIRDHGSIVVIFTKRAERMYRRIAGKNVEVDCTDEPPPDQGPPRAHAFLTPLHPGGFVEVSSGGISMRAPKRGRRLDTGDLTRGLDYCRVWLARQTIRRHGRRVRIARRLIVSVPLTQIGAVFLDEETKAGELLSLLMLAGAAADDLKIRGWPSYAQVIDWAKPLASLLVELSDPSGTPPARKVGYYSDRADHVAVAMLSRSGRRLVIEFDGDLLTTNLAGYLFNER